MGRRLTLGAAIVLIAIGTFAAHTAIKGWQWAIIAAGVSLVGGLLAAELYGELSRLRSRGPGPFERAMAVTRARPARPSDLVALERAFGWRSYSSDDFEHRIKPILVRLHSHVLTERGRSLQPTSFRGELALLAPDATTPDGLDTGDIARIVDAIEELR